MSTSLIKQAKDALTEKKYEKCIELCDEALEIQSKLSSTTSKYPLYVFKGLSLFNLKNRLDDSIEAYESAIKISPNLLPAWQGLCNSLERLKDFDEQHKAKLIQSYIKLCFILGSEKDAKKLEETIIKIAALSDFENALRLYTSWNSLFEDKSVCLCSICELMENSADNWKINEINHRKYRLGASLSVEADVEKEVLKTFPLESIYKLILREDSNNPFVLDKLLSLLHLKSNLSEEDIKLLFNAGQSSSPSAISRLISVEYCDEVDFFALSKKNNLQDICPQDFKSFFKHLTECNEQEAIKLISETGSTRYVFPWIAFCSLLKEKDTTNLNSILVVNKAISLLKSLSLRTKLTFPLRFKLLHMLLCQELIKIGDWEEASSLLKNLSDEHPNDLKVNLLHARMFYLKQKYTEAHSIYKKLLEIYPGNAVLLCELSWMSFHLGNLSEALNLMTESLKVDPDSSKANLRMGKILWNNNDDIIGDKKTQILNCFIKSAKLDPSSAEAFTQLGHYYMSFEKDISRAKKCFLKAQALDPSKEGCALPLAEILFKELNFILSVNVLKDFLTLRPRSFKGWKLLGISQFHLQLYNDAINSLQTSCRIHSNDWFVWSMLSQSYSAEGKYAASLKALQRAVEETSLSDSETRLYLIIKETTIRLELNDWDGALNLYITATITPDSQYYSLYCFSYAKCCLFAAMAEKSFGSNRHSNDLFELGYRALLLTSDKRILNSFSYASLKASFISNLTGEFFNQNYVRIQEIISDPIYELLSPYDLPEQVEEVIKCWLHAIKLDDRFRYQIYSEIVMVLLKVFKTIHNPEILRTALSLILESTKVYADNETVWSTCGIVYSQLGMYKDAEDCFNRACVLNSNNTMIQSNLGFLYIAQNDIAKATALFGKMQIVDVDNEFSWVGLAIINEKVSPQDALNYWNNAFGVADRVDYRLLKGYLLFWIKNIKIRNQPLEKIDYLTLKLYQHDNCVLHEFIIAYVSMLRGNYSCANLILKSLFSSACSPTGNNDALRKAVAQLCGFSYAFNFACAVEQKTASDDMKLFLELSPELNHLLCNTDKMNYNTSLLAGYDINNIELLKAKLNFDILDKGAVFALIQKQNYSIDSLHLLLCFGLFKDDETLCAAAINELKKNPPEKIISISYLISIYYFKYAKSERTAIATLTNCIFLCPEKGSSHYAELAKLAIVYGKEECIPPSIFNIFENNPDSFILRFIEAISDGTATKSNILNIVSHFCFLHPEHSVETNIVSHYLALIESRDFIKASQHGQPNFNQIICQFRTATSNQEKSIIWKELEYKLRTSISNFHVNPLWLKFIEYSILEASFLNDFDLSYFSMTQGLVHLLKNQPKFALKDFQNAFKTFPYLTPIILQAIALIRAGEIDKAKKLLNKTKEKTDPNDYSALLMNFLIENILSKSLLNDFHEFLSAQRNK